MNEQTKTYVDGPRGVRHTLCYKHQPDPTRHQQIDDVIDAARRCPDCTTDQAR
jgi:hypothetical protein